LLVVKDSLDANWPVHPMRLKLLLRDPFNWDLINVLKIQERLPQLADSLLYLLQLFQLSLLLPVVCPPGFLCERY
jgi:hypothetical protein